MDKQTMKEILKKTMLTNEEIKRYIKDDRINIYDADDMESFIYTVTCAGFTREEAIAEWNSLESVEYEGKEYRIERIL